METEQPRRIQRIKSKYWRTPANAVCVHRISGESAGIWGNPFPTGIALLDNRAERREKCQSAVTAFLEWLHTTDEGRAMVERARRDLRGKHLVCWCELDLPCHADVLLAIANSDD